MIIISDKKQNEKQIKLLYKLYLEEKENAC